MKKIRKLSASWLAQSARRGFRGYPIATVALYGPTADLATKIAVSIIPDERNLRQHQARSVVVTDRVIGCPHEEGIDLSTLRSLWGCSCLCVFSRTEPVAAVAV
jgi:hypothetical protein